MPTYSYACRDCDHAFDLQQAFSDDALTVCPNCGGTLRKVYGSVGVVFKGSGFYRTDSRKGAVNPNPKVPAASTSGAGSSGGSDSSSSSSSSSNASSSSGGSAAGGSSSGYSSNGSSSNGSSSTGSSPSKGSSTGGSKAAASA